MAKSKKAEPDDGWLVGTIIKKKFIDGWTNILTGLGTRAKDARTYSSVAWNRLSETDIENLYAGDAMAAKVVDLVVEECFNEGYEITGLNNDQLKAVQKELKRLRFDTTFRTALSKARLYGGSLIFKVYDDDLRVERPVLRLTSESEGISPEIRNRKIKSLIVFQRFEVPAYWQDVQRDILSPDFGCPVLYTFTGRAGSVESSNIKIHASRTVRIDGVWLPDELKKSNNYWGDSVFGKTYDAIRNYAFAHDSVNAALKDLSTAVFKIKNLADMVSADCDEKIIERLEMVNIAKSIARAVVLDAEGEDFDYKTRNLTGAADLVDRSESRLSAESWIPETVLFGKSPSGGLGQSGNHEAENWYKFIGAYQKNKLEEPMIDVVREVAVSLGIDPSKVGLKFNPLWSMSEKEEVEMRDKQSQLDQRYIQEGVLDPSEVRESRFGGDRYTIETVIDPTLEIEAPSDEQLAAVPIRQDMIEEENGKFVLYSSDKSKVLGTFPSRQAATKRLQEIEFFKHKGEKK